MSTLKKAVDKNISMGAKSDKNISMGFASDDAGLDPANEGSAEDFSDQADTSDSDLTAGS